MKKQGHVKHPDKANSSFLAADLLGLSNYHWDINVVAEDFHQPVFKYHR
jgi:hypothetical protein